MTRELIGYVLCSLIAIFIMGGAVYMMLLIVMPPHEAARYVKYAVAVITAIVAYFGTTAWEKRTQRKKP